MIILLLMLLTSSPSEPLYILARFFTGGSGEPRVLGPFPSAELCRIAGRDTFPEDQRFFTPQEIEKETARRKEEDEKKKELIANAIKTKKPTKDGWWVDLGDGCSTVLVNSSGETIISSYKCIVAGTLQRQPEAITGCVTENGAEKAALEMLKVR